MGRKLAAVLGVLVLLVVPLPRVAARPASADGGVCGDLVEDKTGDAHDEATGKPAVIFPEGDLQGGQIFISGGRLWVYFFPAAKLDIAEVEAAGGGYVIYLDLDRDATTGYQSAYLDKVGLGAEIGLFLAPAGGKLVPSARRWDVDANAFQVIEAGAGTVRRSPIPNLNVDPAAVGIGATPFTWLMFAYQGAVSDALPDSGPKTCDPAAAAPKPSPTPTATPTATPVPTRTASPTATATASATVVLPVETPTATPTVETTQSPSPRASVTPNPVPTTGTAAVPAATVDDSGSGNTPLFVLLGFVTTLGGTALGFVTGRKRPGGPPSLGMPAPPPQGPNWRFAPPTVLPLRVFNRAQDEERDRDTCELTVEVRGVGEGTLSISMPSGAIRPMESAALSVTADTPAALLATTSHESKRTVAATPVAGWVDVAWEIVEGAGHFVPSGSTAWLADAESAGAAHSATGNAVVVRGRRGKVLVRCLVTDGRSGDELHRRTITVEIDDSSNAPGQSKESVSLTGDGIETAAEACSISFSPWRDASPLGWRLKVCERTGDAKRLIAAEGDHVVLDATTLFGQATDEDEIDVRAGHEGRPVTRTIRLTDAISYAWSADAGIEASADGTVAVFTAPFLHDAVAGNAPSPRTYEVTARRHDSGKQFVDPTESLLVEVEVRPIVVEWLIVRRVDGTVRSRALRVGEYVYEWEAPSEDAAVRGVLLRALFDEWLAAAKQRGAVSGLRIGRLPSRARQSLRWRMAAMHAFQAELLRNPTAFAPADLPGDAVTAGFFEIAGAAVSGETAPQPDSPGEWLEGAANETLRVRRIEY